MNCLCMCKIVFQDNIVLRKEFKFCNVLNLLELRRKKKKQKRKKEEEILKDKMKKILYFKITEKFVLLERKKYKASIFRMNPTLNMLLIKSRFKEKELSMCKFQIGKKFVSLRLIKYLLFVSKVKLILSFFFFIKKIAVIPLPTPL